MADEKKPKQQKRPATDAAINSRRATAAKKKWDQFYRENYEIHVWDGLGCVICGCVINEIGGIQWPPEYHIMSDVDGTGRDGMVVDRAPEPRNPCERAYYALLRKYGLRQW